MLTEKTAALCDILKTRPLLILGMGNPLRGDDAVGHILAQHLEPLSGDGFKAMAVGVSIENATRWVRETAGGALLLVDAVSDEGLAEGDWALYPPERLDSLCHSTHSIPISMLISYWGNEVPNIRVCFLGIGIRSSDSMAPLSTEIQKTLHELATLIRGCLG